MSIEIGILGFDLEQIKNDELVTIKNNPADKGKEWIYFKDKEVFSIEDGFVIRGCQVMEEFAAHLWTKYKWLVGFDGAPCDGMYTTMMEYHHTFGSPDKMMIDDRDLWDVLSIEYYGQDTIALLKDSEYNHLIPSIEEYINENKPYYQKSCQIAIVNKINKLKEDFDELSKNIHTASFKLNELKNEYCNLIGYEEPEEPQVENIVSNENIPF